MRDSYPFATDPFTAGGRDRTLIASEDFEHLLLIDHGGGVTPDNQMIFQVIDSLSSEIKSLREELGL